MPLYEYEVCVAGTGEVLATITLPLPVDARDEVNIRRRSIPNSLAISGTARDPSSPAHHVLDAYKRIEQRLGNNAAFRRRIGHHPETVKRAWSE